ncbi:MAG: helix-turn-helix domain-containing protein [Deltaproteobacteria bacterium]|nr:helix-turn-helix domain-containing protein [Deltaproteobacteria bacterium]
MPSADSSRIDALTEGPWLTVKQAAAVLGVCTAKIYDWCKEAELEHVRLTTNAIRVSAGAVAEFIARRVKTPRVSGVQQRRPRR